MWWQLSDRFPHLRAICEVLVKIVTGSSRLKSDDLMFKGKSDFEKFYSNCDLGIVKDARHIIMQCPFNSNETIYMYRELEHLEDGIWDTATHSNVDIINILLGCELLDLNLEDSIEILKITGTTISHIYHKVIGTRRGIG